MAKEINIRSANRTTLGNSIYRVNGQPLDDYSIFQTLNDHTGTPQTDATKYAQSSLSYVGQYIAVKTSEESTDESGNPISAKYVGYMISDTDGTLVPSTYITSTNFRVNNNKLELNGSLNNIESIQSSDNVLIANNLEIIKTDTYAGGSVIDKGSICGSGGGLVLFGGEGNGITNYKGLDHSLSDNSFNDSILLLSDGIIKLCSDLSTSDVGYEYYFGGGKITANTFNAKSDARLKENFQPLVPEKSILDLPTYKFDFINGCKNQIGCKAQDLQEICPEIVNEGSDGMLSIQESKIVYLLLEEVKKLRGEINRLKKGD